MSLSSSSLSHHSDPRSGLSSTIPEGGTNLTNDPNSSSQMSTSSSSKQTNPAGPLSLTLANNQKIPVSNLKANQKHAIHLILINLDIQIRSIGELWTYFSKLVKAEKTVQQVLSDLIYQSPNLITNSTNSTTTTVTATNDSSNSNVTNNLGLIQLTNHSMKQIFKSGPKRRFKSGLIWNEKQTTGSDDELSKV